MHLRPCLAIRIKDSHAHFVQFICLDPEILAPWPDFDYVSPDTTTCHFPNKKSESERDPGIGSTMSACHA